MHRTVSDCANIDVHQIATSWAVFRAMTLGIRLFRDVVSYGIVVIEIVPGDADGLCRRAQPSAETCCRLESGTQTLLAVWATVKVDKVERRIEKVEMRIWEPRL